MELKDYLHLYIGCKAIVSKGEDGKLIRDFIGLHNNWSSPVILEIGGHVSEEIPENIKLILRPLSDMTTEESYRWKLKAKSYQSYAATVKYYLDRHFDLFGLINAGLAINSTTLKETIK